MQWPVHKHLDWNIKIKRQGNKTVRHVTGTRIWSSGLTIA